MENGSKGRPSCLKVCGCPMVNMRPQSLSRLLRVLTRLCGNLSRTFWEFQPFPHETYENYSESSDEVCSVHPSDLQPSWYWLKQHAQFLYQPLHSHKTLEWLCFPMWILNDTPSLFLILDHPRTQDQLCRSHHEMTLLRQTLLAVLQISTILPWWKQFLAAKKSHVSDFKSMECSK